MIGKNNRVERAIAARQRKQDTKIKQVQKELHSIMEREIAEIARVLDEKEYEAKVQRNRAEFEQLVRDNELQDFPKELLESIFNDTYQLLEDLQDSWFEHKLSAGSRFTIFKQCFKITTDAIKAQKILDEDV